MSKPQVTIFTGRRDPEYLEEARGALEPARLLETAVTVPEEEKKQIRRIVERLRADGDDEHVKHYSQIAKFEKRCEVSFLGISANTFFDRNGAHVRDGKPILTSALERVFASHRNFLKEDVWLRIRFLFQYPYSSAANSLINAESEVRRTASADQNRIHPSAQLEMQVDQQRFHASSLYASQRNALLWIQRWINAYGWRSRYGNSVTVRFAPTSPFLCCLFINNTAYADSYLLAKEERLDDRLSFVFPLVRVDRNKAKKVFVAMRDHFRYLWQANVTLDQEDATEQKWRTAYAVDRRDEEMLGLQRLRPPQEITFEAKARRLVRHRHIRKSMVNEWRDAVLHQFYRYVTLPEEEVASKRIFISCAWRDDEPHGVARLVERWINWDYRACKPRPEATILRGEPGESLPFALFRLLSVTALGIVFFTKDIRGERHGRALSGKASSEKGGKVNGENLEWYSTPNVYHELGYMMANMQPIRPREPGGNSRIFIAYERGVNIASNIGHLIRKPIDSLDGQQKIKADLSEGYVRMAELLQAVILYRDLMKWLMHQNLEGAELSDVKERILQEANGTLRQHYGGPESSGEAWIEAIEAELKKVSA